MLSIEEKQSILIKRWETIHGKPKAAKAVQPTAAPVAPLVPLKDLAQAIWEASGRDLKTIVPPGKNNRSWYLLELKGKIEWVGNIAIGADKYFDGWWNVVPPRGCMISYVGPGAEQRAKEMAFKIESYYP